MTKLLTTLLVFLAVVAFAIPAFADPPLGKSVTMPQEVQPSATAFEAAAANSKDSVISRGLSMVFFQDQDGSEAKLSVDPQLGADAGCKFRFTLVF